MSQAASNGCVLMFSGGRDSTLSALRLAPQFTQLALVTVTSDHLVGIQAVHDRLAELEPHLASADWLHVRQPHVDHDEDADHDTCLPCHLQYVAVGVGVLRTKGWQHLAFGYAGYQSDWPEQTPAATSLLKSVLDESGIRLHLPVYSLSSRDQAIRELVDLGLSERSLEQKCVLQKFHNSLGAHELSARLQRWASSLRALIANPPELQILDARGR